METIENKKESWNSSQKSTFSDEEDDQAYYSKHNNDLTQLQEDIIYAIESINRTFFIDLGGWGSIDLDFEVNK